MTINHKELHITVTPDGHSAVTWHNLPEGEHVLCGGETGQQVPEPDWTPCSERLPTESDADPNENVWAYNKKKGCVQLVTLYSLTSYAGTIYTHWKPTSLKRPEPPEDTQ